MFKRRRALPKKIVEVVKPQVPLATDASVEGAPVVVAVEEKPKRKPAAHKLYFNSDTQAAIVAYQKTDSKKEHEVLYVTRILPAFEKLVENLINIHKFTSLHDSYDDLKIDCVNFLFETIGKFDETRGSNAFSYFNVVAKNWLIIRTKQKSIRMKRSVSIDDPDALSTTEMRVVEEYHTIPSQDTMMEQESCTENIMSILKDIRSKVKTENELLCINSIVTIFENMHDIDLLNKAAVLLYMRELSGLSPKSLTQSLQQLRRLYKGYKEDAKLLNLF